MLVMDPIKADIAIKDGMVLTMDPSMTILEKADVLISDSKIIAIAPETEYKARKIIEAEKKLIMPGLINTHTHAAMVMKE